MRLISLIIFISERNVKAGDYEAAHYDNPYFYEDFYDKIDNLYDDSAGYAAGTLGRFSGNLSLVFRKENSLKDNNMNLNCKKFKMKDRKF